MATSFLDNRAVISLSGEDLIDFLQGLISNDARLLGQGDTLYAALLSPQGKFLHDFFLIPRGSEILLDVDASRAPDLLSRLKLYRLRSKVVIEPREEAVAVVWNEHLAPGEYNGVTLIADPRLPQMGFRVVGTLAALAAFFADKKLSPATTEDYDAHRISLGVPDGARDMIIDRSLLLECGFEELHGVDFNKGCYVGQEVTARSKFRGQVRKSFYIGRAAAFPETGTQIKSGEQLVGEVRSSVGSIGLLRISSDAAEAAIASGSALQAGGIDIFVSRPIWMSEGQRENKNDGAK